MTPDSGGWLQRLEARADRFIPPAILNHSPEDARQARFAVALAWIGFFFLLLATVVQREVNSRALFVLNLASAILCLAGPFALRRFGRPTLLCHALLAVAFCKYVSVIVLLRGAGLTGAALMLSQLPLIATFLTGVRAGAVWAALTTATVVVVGFLGHAGLISDHLPAGNRGINDHFVLLVSTAVMFSFAALYERRKDAAQRHIYELEALRQATELQRVEAEAKAQLAESERLASLGRIAAATAHEINNPLTSVMTNLELVQESLAGQVPEDLSDALKDALGSARRIARIVADMDLCYQTPSTKLSSVKVADAVELALNMALPHIRTRAQAKNRVDATLPAVVADLSRLAQVLMNLLVNAAQAIVEGHAAENEIAVDARVAGGWVVLEVSDTGSGIPAELVGKVHEPFFTSKGVGKGPGLGLAMCQGIMQGFGGKMAIESRPGHTVVRLTLAVAGAQPATAVPEDDSGSPLNILIVDDEEAVARTLKRILTAHSVTFAAGGREALEILERETQFDLVFCDMMMPELTGMDLFERVQSANPRLAERFVFVTGGTFTERAHTFRQSVPNLFLEKPFDVPAVRDVVKKRAALLRGAP